jgi:hypothetical protein
MTASKGLDCESLPTYLARRLPSSISDIREETEPGDPAWLVAVDLLRDVFTYKVFRRAVQAADSQMLDICYSMVEDLLSAEDERLRGYAVEYVVSAVLSTDMWARETQTRAGHLLRTELDLERGGRSWRTQKGGFGDERPAPRGATIGVHLYSDAIYVHAFQPLVDGGSGIMRPFATLAAGSEPEVVGAAISGILYELLDSPVNDSSHQVDQFLQFVGGIGWTAFYTQSRSVDVAASEDGFGARVWARHKRQDREWFGNRQGEMLTVEDWRDADAIGRAVLTALAISSTTGWNDPR